MPISDPPTRREFLRTTACSGAAVSLHRLGAGTLAALTASSSRYLPAAPLSKFKLGLITDEVSTDLEVAIKFLQSFKLHWVELRNLWNGYVTEAPAGDIDRAKKLLTAYQMRVSVIDTAFYKCLLPGTSSKFMADPHSARTPAYEEQVDLLRRAMDRAKAFHTRYLRIFAFFRIDNPSSVFELIVENLKKAVKVAERSNIVLLLENEHTCNAATAHETARILQAIRSPNLAMTWDPGNAFVAGETPYPDGYQLLDKKRILHMHLKDAQINPETRTSEWLPIGGGRIDYLGQMRALLKDGYKGTMSLETHYQNKAKDKEGSSRESMQGLLRIIEKA